MCDYSLTHAKSRAAQKGDKLITRNFGKGTRGFAGLEDKDTLVSELTAVCVLPGTELAFEKAPKLYYDFDGAAHPQSTTARFRQIDKDVELCHHDALEFASGEIVKLTQLAEDLVATVLQLPAEPKNEAERKEQERVVVKEHQPLAA